MHGHIPYFDSSYLIILPAILFALYAQTKVSSTFNKYKNVYNRRGLTSQEVARRILDENGLTNVTIEHISGNLTDHFDPSVNVVRLSDSVYNSNSVAAIGVAAHEVGHAIQHATEYSPIKIRNAILPIVNIGSNLATPIVIAGLIFSFQPLISIGIFLFTFIVFFQAITLPVEFNASSRALQTLESFNILDVDELQQSKSVLRAAAMTYVAALLSALLSLVRLLIISNGRRRD